MTDNFYHTDGLVIREQFTAEADKIVTLLTRDKGLVRAFAKGARRPKNRLYAATSLLCYGHFVIIEKEDKNIISEASLDNQFYGIYRDIVKLSLAQHFCQLAAELVMPGDESEEQLRLLLNALYFLENDKLHHTRLKPLVQLRLLSLAGYAPNLICCNRCGKFESEYMAVDIKNAVLYCDECSGGLKKIPLSAVNALRHILFSELTPLFKFSVSDNDLAVISTFVDSYLTYKISKELPTLSFYKSLL